MGDGSMHRPQLTRERFDAVLFDLDGVLTATAKLHAAAWKRTFDRFLQRWAAMRGETSVPFDMAGDYLPFSHPGASVTWSQCSVNFPSFTRTVSNAKASYVRVGSSGSFSTPL